MKKLIVIIIGVMITVSTWGAKAYPEPMTITQKDGKQLTFYLNGDEHFHYFTTTDGILLRRDGDDYYIALIDEEGKMSSSGVLAHNAGQRTAEEIALIGKQDKMKFFEATKKRVVRRAPLVMNENTTTLFPHTGSPTALVILADFTDQSFKHDDDTTLQIFDQYLNAPTRPYHKRDKSLGYNLSSVRKYFEAVSGGQFIPLFDVKTVVHLDGPMATYGANSYDEEGNLIKTDPNISSFINKVCNKAYEQGVDFSHYDANNDGYVDLVYIIFAGFGESSTGSDPNTIWPKSGSGNYGTYNGKTVCRYGVHSELNFNPQTMKDNPKTFPASDAYPDGEPWINGIGLFCHEFSHCMGLPDIYPTIKEAQTAGNPAMEYWDLMDGGEYTYNGGYAPTAYTAWEKEFMGWMEMEVLKQEHAGQLITLKSLEDTNGKAYKIYPNDDENSNEYVYLQNIQSLGLNVPLGELYGHGMLVNYVKYDATAFSILISDYYGGNSVNNEIGKSRMTIVPADGLLISSYLSGKNKTYTQAEYKDSHAGDPFPGTSDVHELLSIPMIWSGVNMEKPLLNIQENNKVITFYYLTDPTQIVTGINHVDDSHLQGNRIYTLDGRYVGSSLHGLKKGIYIANGKKTVVR